MTALLASMAVLQKAHVLVQFLCLLCITIGKGRFQIFNHPWERESEENTVTSLDLSLDTGPVVDFES
jgi:hypothetical protein